MFSNETTQSFLRRARKRLDQELDVETNFWSAAEMLEYANEGCREVWQTIREGHQNWFIRQMASTDGVVTIGGRRYDTTNLKFVNAREKLFLPPDFRELVLIEGVPGSDTEVNALVLEYANLTQRAFRNETRPLPTDLIVRRYHYDVVYGAEGPYIFLAPKLSMESDMDARIAYVAAPIELTTSGGFDGTGFTTEMVDAVLAYTLLAAAGKEDVAENLSTFEKRWSLKKELASRSAGPKQTRDEEPVDGYLEEELV